MTHTSPGRMLLTSATIFVVVFWMAMITSSLDNALFKTTIENYFNIRNQKTANAISVVHERRYFRWFLLYSTAVAAAVPFLYHQRIKNTAAAVAIVIVLWSPCVWYGSRVSYVAGKMVDWTRVFHDRSIKDSSGHSRD